MVLFDVLQYGAVVEVGEAFDNVDRQYGVVVVVVEECLCKLVKFFSTRGASDGVLVWFEGLGNGWCDLFGNGGSGYPMENGATCDMLDAAVGFE